MKRLSALLFALLFVAAACGSDSGSSSDTTTTTEPPEVTAGIDVTSVSDDLAAPPEIEFESTDTAPTQLVTDDVVEGDGEVLADGDEVEVQYTGWLTNGVEFDSTWLTLPAQDGSEGDAETLPGLPFTFTQGDAGTVAGFAQGIEGMKVGGRRLVIIPPELAYGERSTGPIPENATLTFVIDLIAATPPPPAGADVTNVSEDLETQPEFDIEGTDTAPTELVVEDVVTGDGTEATAGKLVTVQYVGVLTDDTEFDSSWGRGEPFEFALGEGQVIAGWDEGILGMKEGGRRLLVIPADLAYGPAGSGDIPGGATLIFVVDLVTVAEPGAVNASVTGITNDLTAKPEFEIEGTDDPLTELVVEDVIVGDGAEAAAGDAVTMQYVGVLTDGTEFDASWDRAEPFGFTLGQGEVIAGWDEGVAGMKVGGRRLLIIPAEQGYGTTGSPPTIRGGATLVFVVDLVSVG